MSALRKRTAELLQANRPDDPASRIVDLFLIVLIVSNIFAAMFATMPPLRSAGAGFFWAFEVFSVLVFSVEYLLRLWSCVEKNRFQGMSALKARLRWIFSPLGLIDLLAILPFYILFFAPVNSQSALLLRMFRGLRLLRIFKLSRYSPALQVFRNVLRQESGTLLVVGFILIVILIMASWGIYILENEAQPEYFGSIPQSMWWAVISLTTVGYGDVVPLTTLGKFFTGIIALIGIGFAALPAGIMASGFSSEMRRREHAYNRALSSVLRDGKISRHETEELERVREELGLGEDEAHSLYLDARRNWMKHSKCPHCGKPLQN
jgi:voltage-gated potassium channel